MMTINPPPLMLGERPALSDGGITFRQVPYVSVNARVEKGTVVRKHLKKYLESSAHSHFMYANTFLNDIHVNTLQSEEITNSSMEEVFRCLHRYNQIVGTKAMEINKAFSQLAAPLDHSSRVRKWSRENYNMIQKCVQDVANAEKRMERGIARRDKAIEEHSHWKRIFDMNAATLAMQPHNVDCQKALQVSQAKVNAAAEEERVGLEEYEECKSALHSAIEHRDDMVEESTEASQTVEEDRIETMILILQQFIQVKQSALSAEMEGLKELARLVSKTDKAATIQQYITDNMQPDITHRHSKALFLLEWHWKWHLERIELARNEPEDYLNLNSDALPCLQGSSMTVHDVEVMKDFIACCFLQPDISRMILDPAKVSRKHRRRFVDPKSKALYRMDTVRKILVAALNHQRTHSLELSVQGYEALSASMNLLLSGCMDRGDTKCAKSVMNMAQTFYCVQDSTQKYLLNGIINHPIWQTSHFWGDAVLMSIGEELSRNPMDSPWHYWPPAKRSALVLSVHNTVFGQLSTYLFNMAAFRLSKQQIMQFVQNVAYSFELSEDQRIQLLSSVSSLETVEISEAQGMEGDDAAMFTTAIFPEWRKSAPPGRTPLQKMRYGLSKIKGIFDQDTSVQAASTQALLANAQAGKTSEMWETLFGEELKDKKMFAPSQSIELTDTKTTLVQPASYNEEIPSAAPSTPEPSILPLPPPPPQQLVRVESEDEGIASRTRHEEDQRKRENRRLRPQSTNNLEELLSAEEANSWTPLPRRKTRPSSERYPERAPPSTLVATPLTMAPTGNVNNLRRRTEAAPAPKSSSMLENISGVAALRARFERRGSSK
ncbi:hypothetical protein THRCLA_02087 [Thraustotheca clavata]|uniref:SBF1/SBF2 domain-containing protein n=1 Tax=Thraustotheca clavata TaxID=74557 RepID=A0A1W0A6A8_9STRA|nr:hypothetical protein THRCLA_02087 [Thraustotheca clavata]